MVTALSPTLLTPAYHSTVVFNNKLYVIMDGLDDHVTVLSSSDGIDWNIETDNAFSNREDFEAVVFENAIYVIGGKHLDSSFNEIWKSTDGIEWNLVTPSTDIFSPRYSHTATVHNNKVWIVGGVTGPLDETHIDFGTLKIWRIGQNMMVPYLLPKVLFSMRRCPTMRNYGSLEDYSQMPPVRLL